ncbi:MAG: magnesium-translocating P-type ATPase [Betaproteobacteria bacterium]|jgi:Mg2+-importing ATPase
MNRRGPGSFVIGDYWSPEAGEILAALQTSPAGLAGREAAHRLALHGSNTVESGEVASALRLFLAQFSSPLVLILIVGAAISLLVQDWVEAWIILSIVCGSCLLGFVQEYRASNAVAALRARLALRVRVRRDGVVSVLDAALLVPGDIVELAAGNLVPADGHLLEARDFLVSEASLTGESFPVEKTAGTQPPATAPPTRANCVYLGTSVRSGKATMLVVHTGTDTAFGALAASLRRRPAETAFNRGVRDFGFLLLRLMIVMVLFVLIVNQWLQRPVLESLMFAMALAVGLSPELLPAIVSVMLSHGARSMAREGVIVRRLEAIENLGSIDVLCSDKTGTLTTGQIVLQQAVDASGAESTEVLRLSWLNAALETGIDNPLDAAIVAAGTQAGLSLTGHAKVDEIPYDFMRKRLTIVVAPAVTPAEHLIITKGAHREVLAACTAVAAGEGSVPLDATVREKLDVYCRQRGEAGFRVLALAIRRVPARATYRREDEAGMTLAGFLLFSDPPRADAPRVIADLAGLGIRLKVITGDNRHVSAHLARALGLDPAAMLCGAEIARIGDEALWSLAPRTDFFVEVDPQQKERIVAALQRCGHVVGYMGDGINDAPALHAADIGISVDGATDVARESAGVILLRPDLDVLRKGIESGRRTFANTLKYIAITSSANFGNMLSMALATPLLPFLPLAAKQILLNNFLSDLPALAIATDRVDPAQLRVPQQWDARAVGRFMVVFGLVSTLFDLLAFVILLHWFDAGESLFQTAWFVVSLLTELAVVLLLRTRGPALASRPGALLAGAAAAVALLAVALPYLPPVAALFGFVPLPWPLLAASLLIVAGYVVVTEAVKRLYRAPSRPAA